MNTLDLSSDLSVSHGLDIIVFCQVYVYLLQPALSLWSLPDGHHHLCTATAEHGGNQAISVAPTQGGHGREGLHKNSSFN